MDKFKKSKEIYDHIPIPEKLQEVVLGAIKESDQKRQEQFTALVPDHSGKEKPLRKHRQFGIWCRRGIKAAAVLLIMVTAAANSNQAFALEMHKIPVLGSLIKLLTVRSYEYDDGDKKISIKIPGVEFVGDVTNDFSSEVNQIISDRCNAYASEAQLRADQYKEAFIATGGTKEQWDEHQIEIKVWYDIKSQNEEYLSFVVTGTESWTSAYTEIRYYNLNLKNAQSVSLEDVLGGDYIQLANASIKSQMEIREKETGEQFWTEEEDGFQTITDETRFYLNEKGCPVIVFKKYEIGPGSMGEVEFEIERKE